MYLNHNIERRDLIARKKREWYPGAILHVMARGIRRKAIFREEDDFKIFLKIVEEVQSLLPFEIYAYCLMTNHFHMLIKTEDKEIWHIMKRILSGYARTFNQKYNYTGHLFDSRYTSKIVNDTTYLLEVSRYIHLNPVRAGMVLHPAEYEFGSYKTYLGQADIPLVNSDAVLNTFLRDPVAQYQKFVEDKIPHDEIECQIQKDMKEDERWLPW